MNCVNASYWANPKNRDKQSLITKKLMKNILLRKKVGDAVRKALNSPDVKNKISGKNSTHWKGDKVGYHALHSWILKNHGKANCCENSFCQKKSKNYTWANVSGKYARNMRDFIKLCRSCHSRFDYGWTVIIKNASIRKGDIL